MTHGKCLAAADRLGTAEITTLPLKVGDQRHSVEAIPFRRGSSLCSLTRACASARASAVPIASTPSLRRDPLAAPLNARRAHRCCLPLPLHSWQLLPCLVAEGRVPPPRYLPLAPRQPHFFPRLASQAVVSPRATSARTPSLAVRAALVAFPTRRSSINLSSLRCCILFIYAKES